MNQKIGGPSGSADPLNLVVDFQFINAGDNPRRSFQPGFETAYCFAKREIGAFIFGKLIYKSLHTVLSEAMDLAWDIREQTLVSRIQTVLESLE